MRQLLVGSQVALAVILLAGAALLTRSVQRLESIDLGFRSAHLSVVSLSIPDTYGDHPVALADRILPRVAAVQGVIALTPTIIDPLIGSSFFLGVWQTDQESAEDVARSPLMEWDAIGPDYFRALGISIIRGRGFLDTDNEHSAPVALVSAAVARRYWPGQDPIGKRIRMSDDAWTKEWRTVVGVVGETHWRSLREATPMVYMPYQQSMWHGFIAIRTARDLGVLLPAIRQAIHEVSPDVAVWKAETMDNYLAKPLAQPRMSAMLLSSFGFIGLLLAAIGLYGIMASAVREQTRDIGVRMALGATPAQVRGEVLRRAMAICLTGATVGLTVSLIASRLVTSMLFGVSPTDPVALLGACGVLLAVACMAAYLPAHHASRIHPARALRVD